MKRSRLRPMSAKRRRALAQYRKARKDALSRAGEVCEARIPGTCEYRAQITHHVILRSQGGPDEAWNLLATCDPCHRWAHDHPQEARRRGLIRQRGAA